MSYKNALLTLDEHTSNHKIEKPLSEALMLAMLALAKQIPTKMDYQDEGYYDKDGKTAHDNATCHYCSCRFLRCGDDWECNFCPNCGQALDWNNIDKSEELK